MAIPKPVICCCLILLACLLTAPGGFSAEENAAGSTAPGDGQKAPKLIQALVCENVVEGIPQEPAIVFSISRGKVSCYTFFDPVPANTFVTHNWYYRDEPSARIRLQLRPPRWATFSTIQLRETDKGPWRVEITDAAGLILKELRFSITD
jgi:hypothetical protein